MNTATDILESAMESHRLDQAAWVRGRNVIVFLALISWAACLFGYFSNRTQFIQSYLVGFLLPMTICLGALFFVQVMYLTGSAWSVTMRRFAEAMMVSIPVGALLFLPIAFNMDVLYKWMDPKIVTGDHILEHKAPYLNQQFFLIRTAAYFVIWSIWSIAIYRQSVAQDKDGDIRHMRIASRWSAPGLLVSFLTVSLASFDWVMSLDPHWFSTIFGIYVYAGGAMGFIAALALIALAFRRSGVLKYSINSEHYHDLGKWMFALTCFWAYIAFSQYMLIWYANMPEETIFFKHRLEGSWWFVSMFLVFGHFIFPFLLLLPRSQKRNLGVLSFAGAWLLIVQFIDLYWLVSPNFQTHGIHPHWLDLVTPIATTSVFAFVFWGRLKNNALMPVGDARFNQALEFRNV